MAGAILGGVGSILGGITGGKGASAAAKAQAQTQQAALAQQQAQFAQTQQNIAPYLASGQQGLAGQQTLLGLNGQQAQQGAINNLENGAQYQSQYGQGLDAILQNAAATGGLRGGNTALAQSNFGANLLGTVIQNQLANYQGLAQQGVQAAGGLASAGQANANAQAGIYGQLGNSNATSALAPYAGLSSAINGLGQSGIFNSFGGASGGNAAANAGLGSYANTFLTSGNTYNPLNKGW